MLKVLPHNNYMLYSERKRLKDLSEKEAAGNNVWTKKISSALRQKVIWCVESYGGNINYYDPQRGSDSIFGYAHLVLTRDLGVTELHGYRNANSDFIAHVRNCTDDEFPDAIESLYRGLSNALADTNDKLGSFTQNINNLLADYRVSYTLENAEVVDFESKELHDKIIVPTLRLISETGWNAVEKAYQEALKQIVSNPQNSITDSTTALQEGLRKIGCKGKDFAALKKSAKESIFKGYNSKFLEAIDNLIDWSSAMRVNRGDGDEVADATPNEAWFVVHTVGILLLVFQN